MKKLIHELEVHQIELEMQNEELRTIQLELDNTRQKYFDLYDLAPVGYLTINEKGIITEANLTAAKLFGIDQNKLKNKPITNFIVNEDQDIFYLRRKQLFETNTNQKCEFRMLRNKKTPFWTFVEVAVARGCNNRLYYIAAINDITERKRAEEKLKESEKQYRRFFDEDLAGDYVSTPDGKILICNKAFANIIGCESVEQVLQMNAFDLYLEQSDRNEFLNKLREKRQLEFYESTLRRCDGRIIYVLENVVGKYDENGDLIEITGYLFDITSRKKAEEEIISQKNRFTQLFNNSPIAIALLDDQGKIVLINESFSALFDYFQEEIKGQALNDIIVPLELKEEAETYSNETLSGNQINKESYRRRKDGTFVYVQIIGIPVIANDKVIGIYGMYIDLTQRKNVEGELIKAKELAEKSNKLKSEFLAQISHEIRTPINIVINFSSIIKEELVGKLTPELLEYFDGIDSAGQRLIRTIDLILNASEMQVGTYEPTFIEFDLIGEIIEKIKHNYIKLIENKGLKLNFISNVPTAVIHGDKYSIYQLFVNLIDNAIKYTGEGSISIKIAKSENEPGVNVSIEDTGIGMSEEFMKVMYQPFTQEARGYSRRFEGSGLGLAIVKKYCDLNGITITVESKKGEGSKFTLIFADKK